jgi:hypothetical protein
LNHSGWSRRSLAVEIDEGVPQLMFSSRHTRLFIAVSIASTALLFASITRSTPAQDATSGNHEPTNVIVNVKEADTGDPVGQAAVTLQFTEPVPFGHGKKHSYNAKSDSQGRCKLFGINKGKIVLMVTAARHQSYGKELQLDQDNQVFEVRLKKPQPLI